MEDGFMELRDWAPVRARQSVEYPCPYLESALFVFIGVHSWFRQVESQLAGEALRANPVEGGEVPDAPGLLVRPSRISSSHRGNHQVLRGMIGRNEFEYLGVVPGPFEQVSAQRVGDKLRLPLKQDAVLERLRKNRRRAELRAQLLMTAGCDEYQCGAGLDTF